MSRDYSKVSPRFWTGETGRNLVAMGPDSVAMALYLITGPHANMLGLYYLPIPYICEDLGIPLEGASKALARVCEGGFARYDEASRTVFVPKMAQWQVGSALKASDNRVKSINKDFQSLPKSPFLREFFEIYRDAYHLEEFDFPEAPSKPLRSQEQEQEQEQEKERDPIGSCRAKPPDDDSPDENPAKTRKPTNSQAREILDHLNASAGKSYEPVDANLSPIKARLGEYGTAKLMAVVDAKCSEWRNDEQMAKYLRPATLFNATKCAQYVGDLGAKPRNGSGDDWRNDPMFQGAL